MLEAAKAGLEKLHDRIKELEAENAKLKIPNTCDRCKWVGNCVIHQDAIKFLSWREGKQVEESFFGCIYHEVKAP